MVHHILLYNLFYFPYKNTLNYTARLHTLTLQPWHPQFIYKRKPITRTQEPAKFLLHPVLNSLLPLA
uniref:Uncharacterized protein n=1 Tax=Rhizophora mucronata TaxID=61149 RepID=A0A2P2N5I8_RHIMU